MAAVIHWVIEAGPKERSRREEEELKRSPRELRGQILQGGRRSSVEHRGIAFSVVEMSFSSGWRWTVGKGRTVTVGVCATRLDAIRQARTFIDAVVDWAA
jgi:hypothetical protein